MLSGFASQRQAGFTYNSVTCSLLVLSQRRHICGMQVLKLQKCTNAVTSIPLLDRPVAHHQQPAAGSIGDLKLGSTIAALLLHPPVHTIWLARLTVLRAAPWRRQGDKKNVEHGQQ